MRDVSCIHTHIHTDSFFQFSLSLSPITRTKSREMSRGCHIHFFPNAAAVDDPQFVIEAISTHVASKLSCRRVSEIFTYTFARIALNVLNNTPRKSNSTMDRILNQFFPTFRPWKIWEMTFYMTQFPHTHTRLFRTVLNYICNECETYCLALIVHIKQRAFSSRQVFFHSSHIIINLHTTRSPAFYFHFYERGEKEADDINLFIGAVIKLLL